MLHILYFIIIPKLLLLFFLFYRRRKCIFIQVSPKLGKLRLRFKLNSVHQSRHKTGCKGHKLHLPLWHMLVLA